MTSSLPKARLLQAGAALLSLLVVSFMVMRTSTAAFNASTENATNNWAAGSVVLTDNDSGAAMFTTANSSNMVPGDVRTRCINVNYEGTSYDLESLKLRASASGSGLQDDLDVTVEVGTGAAAFGDCTGFTPALTGATLVSNQPLDAFATSSTATPVDTKFKPTSTDKTRSFRFTVKLGTDTPNTEQTKNAAATFTWDIRSDDSTA